MLPGADEYLRAFSDLSGDRQMGMAAGPIPYTSIDRWAERNGIIDPDDFAALRDAIAVMDEVWRGGDAKTPVGRPLTPELFDAVF